MKSNSLRTTTTTGGVTNRNGNVVKRGDVDNYSVLKLIFALILIVLWAYLFFSAGIHLTRVYQKEKNIHNTTQGNESEKIHFPRKEDHKPPQHYTEQPIKSIIIEDHHHHHPPQAGENVIELVDKDKIGRDHVHSHAPGRDHDHSHTHTSGDRLGRDHVHSHTTDNRFGRDHVHSHTTDDRFGRDHVHSHATDDKTGRDHVHSHTTDDRFGSDHVHSHTSDDKTGRDNFHSNGQDKRERERNGDTHETDKRALITWRDSAWNLIHSLVNYLRNVIPFLKGRGRQSVKENDYHHDQRTHSNVKRN